jgi:hypothetical protein
MTNLTHNSFFFYVHFNLLHVSSNLVFIIRRINCINRISGICHSVLSDRLVLPDLHTGRPLTQSDINQKLYWCNWFSWWWARGCSKHVKNWDKHIRTENCASSWSFTRMCWIEFAFYVLLWSWCCGSDNETDSWCWVAYPWIIQVALGLYAAVREVTTRATPSHTHTHTHTHTRARARARASPHTTYGFFLINSACHNSERK